MNLLQSDLDNMTDSELIEKLEHGIEHHIIPHNIGDNEETKVLVLEAIKRLKHKSDSEQRQGEARPL